MTNNKQDTVIVDMYNEDITITIKNSEEFLLIITDTKNWKKEVEKNLKGKNLIDKKKVLEEIEGKITNK